LDQKFEWLAKKKDKLFTQIKFDLAIYFFIRLVYRITEMSATFTNDPAAGVMITLINASGVSEGPAQHIVGADPTSGSVSFPSGAFTVDSTNIGSGLLTLTGQDGVSISATNVAPPTPTPAPAAVPTAGGRRRRRGKKMSKKMMKRGGRRSRRSKGTAKAAKMLKSMSKSLRMMSKM